MLIYIVKTNVTAEWGDPNAFPCSLCSKNAWGPKYIPCVPSVLFPHNNIRNM